LIFQIPVRVIFSAGIVAGIGLFHPEKEYPVLVGSLGAVIGES
jgi:hypothetical protein